MPSQIKNVASDNFYILYTRLLKRDLLEYYDDLTYNVSLFSQLNNFLFSKVANIYTPKRREN